MSAPKLIGTAFSREEARRALSILDRAIETDAGFKLARESGAVVAIFGALVILDDYVANSNPIPLQRDEKEKDDGSRVA